jgi:hypothetical protein
MSRSKRNRSARRASAVRNTGADDTVSNQLPSACLRHDGSNDFFAEHRYPFASDRARLLPIGGELVAMSGDGELIALRVTPTEVDLIDRTSRTVSRLALDPTQPLEKVHLAMSRQLDVLYQFYETGAVIACEMRTGRELARIQLTDTIWPWSAVASRDAV